MEDFLAIGSCFLVSVAVFESSVEFPPAPPPKVKEKVKGEEEDMFLIVIEC